METQSLRREIEKTVKYLRAGIVNQSTISTMQTATTAVQFRADYASECRTLRKNYLGDQEARTREVLGKRYRNTAWRMPVNVQNITTETAELSAQVYRQTPERESESEYLLDVIERSVMGTTLLEVERIACIAGTSFLLLAEVEDENDEDAARIATQAIWPNQVLALVDERKPWSLNDCHAVAVQVAGNGTDLPRLIDSYTLWVAKNDHTSWDVYAVTDTKGTKIGESTALPLIDLRLRPSSSIFAPLARDLLLLQDQVNVTLSDHHYRYSLQAHRQIVTSGPMDKHGKERTLSPDSIIEFPPDVTVTTLQENDSLSAFDAVSSMLVLHGRSVRQPIEAWHTKGGNPESGESRKIKNEWADQKRAEHVEMIEIFERRWSLALSSMLADAGLMAREDVWVDATFPPPIVYESESAKTDRVTKLLTANLITKAKAAEMLGLAPIDEEEGAVVDGDADGGISAETTAEQDSNMATTLNELSLAIERLVRAGDLALLNATRAAYIQALGAAPVAPLAEMPTSAAESPAVDDEKAAQKVDDGGDDGETPEIQPGQTVE